MTGLSETFNPCVLALAGFPECCRSYALSINRTAFDPIPCVDVEHSILSSSYDGDTVFSHTLCVLYDMLERILDHDLNAHAIWSRPNNMFDLHCVG